MKIGTHIGFVADVEVVRNGQVIDRLDDQKNLLLDAGLAKVFATSESSYATYGHYGTSDDANQRDSGTVTLSRIGDVVTANGAFFDASDVGSLIKWDSDEEDYITAYNSPTEVETANSGAIAADEATVWHVNRTQLVSPLERTSRSGSSTSFSAGVYKRISVYDFDPEGSLTTVKEVGFGADNTNAICSRVVLSVPVVLQAGDQLRLTATLELVASPNTPTAYDPTAGGSEESGDGQGQFEWADDEAAWDTIWPGRTFSDDSKELIFLDEDPLPFSAYGTGRVFNGNGMIPNSYNNFPDTVTVGAAPTQYPFSRSTELEWSPTRISGTFYGFVMVRKALVGTYSGSGSNEGYGRFVWVFDTPVPKSSSQRARITVTETVDRNLVN